MHYGVDHVVEAQLWQDRSLPHLRLYWVVLHEVVTNSDGMYGRAEDLHDVLKVTLGYSRRIRLLIPNEEATKGVKRATAIILRVREWIANFVPKTVQNFANVLPWLDMAIEQIKPLADAPQTIVLPGSISLTDMDQAEFKVFFDAAMNELRKAGYDVDAYIDSAKKKMVSRRQA